MIRRVGLVGFGAVAEKSYLPVLSRASVTISSIAEVSSIRREAAGRLFPSATLYSGLGELLSHDKSLDALIVTTPPLYHAEAVLAGLNSGLHVLCEKPLTLDPESLARIEDTALDSDRTVYSVNNWAYSPQWSRLFSLVGSGRLGMVRHAELRVLRTRPSVSASPGDWRKDPRVAGGGILVDHGWHALYLLRRLLGPGARLAGAALSPEGPVDEVSTALLAAPGASGVIHLSWRAAERSNWAFVAGERGTLELRDDVLILRAGGREETERFAEKLSAGSAHPEWLASMWPAFEAECAGRGRGRSLEEASFCLQALRAAYAGTLRETARG